MARHKKRNPIGIKLMSLINSGKTIAVPATKIKISKELICFLSDLKYQTLENVFYRPVVSYATLKSLKFAGLISDKDESEYRAWLAANIPQKKKKGDLNGNREEADNTTGEPEEQTEGSESGSGSEI